MKVTINLILLLTIVFFEGLPPGSRLEFLTLDDKPIPLYMVIDGKCFSQIPLPNPVFTGSQGKMEVCIFAKHYRVKVVSPK